MKTIARNLPVNIPYQFDSCETHSKEDMTTCDNCGLFIVNVCWIKSVNGRYKVGPDCVDRLTSMEADQKKETLRKLHKMQTIEKKFRKVIAEGGTLLIERGEHRTWFHDSRTTNWVFWLCSSDNEGAKGFIDKWASKCQPYVKLERVA